MKAGLSCDVEWPLKDTKGRPRVHYTLAGNPGSPTPPPAPSGRSKFLPFFITTVIYEKLLKYSWVPGG